MKRLNCEPKGVVCANPHSVFRYFGWPSVARLADGTLAAGASGFRMKHICPFGKVVICYSRDEGRTWTAPAVVMDTPLDDRDTGIVPFGNNRVIVTSFNNTVSMQRKWNAASGGEHQWSADSKRAFSEAYLRIVEETGAEETYIGSTYRISEDGGYTFGPILKAPITAPHGPCAMRDGSILYIGRRFSKDDSKDDGLNPFIECWKLNARDEWTYVSSIENVWADGELLLSCEPHGVQLADGRIIVHIRVQGKSKNKRYFTLYQSISSDEGKTFSQPRQLLADCGGAPAHLLYHSSGVLISAYGYREAPYGVRVMFSPDGGETWEKDWILDDTAPSADVGYPATVELADGRLLTVYYENIGENQSVISSKIWTIPQLERV